MAARGRPEISGRLLQLEYSRPPRSKSTGVTGMVNVESVLSAAQSPGILSESTSMMKTHIAIGCCVHGCGSMGAVHAGGVPAPAEVAGTRGLAVRSYSGGWSCPSSKHAET